MSSSTITPITMNLTGQYATDFQAILNKAVQTAGVPLTLLQNADTAVLSSKSALSSLQSTAAALTGSLTALGKDAASQALGATSSNTAAVTATDSGATAAATYTINSVTSIATAASETSLKGYANTDPISSGNLDLVVGSKNFNFTLTNNTLAGLVTQINGLGSGVTASVLTTANGNYLSLQATGTGATTLQLNAGANNLISAANQGTNAVFQLNGINISQASNTVNSVISGMTLNIVGATQTPLTVSLASNASQVTSDLQGFVTNYNSLVTAMAAQEGQSGGPLVGDTVIQQLKTAMSQMTSYTGSSGTVQSLADLGVTFNSTNGLATLDQTVIGGMSSARLTDALNYVGSTTTGLGAFSKTFTQFSDPISGMIQTEIAGDTASDSHLQSQMTTTIANINLMQKNLATQIEKADALESAYESQQTELTASVQGLNMVLYGKYTGV